MNILRKNIHKKESKNIIVILLVMHIELGLHDVIKPHKIFKMAAPIRALRISSNLDHFLIFSSNFDERHGKPRSFISGIFFTIILSPLIFELQLCHYD